MHEIHSTRVSEVRETPQVQTELAQLPQQLEDVYSTFHNALRHASYLQESLDLLEAQLDEIKGSPVSEVLIIEVGE
jgi:hypothetical protein